MKIMQFICTGLEESVHSHCTCVTCTVFAFKWSMSMSSDKNTFVISIGLYGILNKS